MSCITKRQNLPFASDSLMAIRGRERGLVHPTLHACVKIAIIAVENRIEKIFISIAFNAHEFLLPLTKVAITKLLYSECK